MGKFSRAFKDAKVAFKESVAYYKNEMICKSNLDKILDAYAILPEYVKKGYFREYVLSEIALFEMAYHTEYLRKSELEIVEQPIAYKDEEPVEVVNEYEADKEKVEYISSLIDKHLKVQYNDGIDRFTDGEIFRAIAFKALECEYGVGQPIPCEPVEEQHE